MNTWRQLLHIAREFGFGHAVYRVGCALRAMRNDHARTRQHKRRIQRMQVGQTITLACLGKLFELRTDDFGLYRDLISDRIREPVATSLMLRYAQPNSVLLDAGANIGYFSVIMADRCKEVHAVEPVPTNFASLERNIRLNGIINVHTYQLAFSDQNGEVFIEASERSNWFRTSKERSAGDQLTVRALTIDSFCAKHGIRPTILKMDLEGFERFVLPAAYETLRHVQHLFFELHSSLMSLAQANNILDTLAECGLTAQHVIRYDRPGLWIEEEAELAIARIRRGDYGIYELICNRNPHAAEPV